MLNKEFWLFDVNIYLLQTFFDVNIFDVGTPFGNILDFLEFMERNIFDLRLSMLVTRHILLFKISFTKITHPPKTALYRKNIGQARFTEIRNKKTFGSV